MYFIFVPSLEVKRQANKKLPTLANRKGRGKPSKDKAHKQNKKTLHLSVKKRNFYT
jgi:hypothetical protein